MGRIPEKWVEDNKDFLRYITSNPLIQGKKDFVSYDKLKQWLKSHIQDIDSELIRDNIASSNFDEIISSMEYYKIITSKRSSGVIYIIPEEDYFKIKNDLLKRKEENIELSRNVHDSDSNITAFQYIYNKISTFSGDGKEFIEDLPDLLDLSVKIIYDDRSDWKSRNILSSVLGYVLIDNNNSNNEDYFDDLFIVTFSLNYISRYADYLLKSNWIHPNNLHTILKNGYYNSRLVISDAECKRILRLVGIPQIIKYEENFDKRTAVGLISYLMGQLYNISDKSRTIEYAEKKMQSLGVYDDVQRILKISKGELIPKSENEKTNDIVLTDEECDILLSMSDNL